MKILKKFKEHICMNSFLYLFEFAFLLELCRNQEKEFKNKALLCEVFLIPEHTFLNEF
jgi:hypothetical protein